MGLQALTIVKEEFAKIQQQILSDELDGFDAAENLCILLERIEKRIEQECVDQPDPLAQYQTPASREATNALFEATGEALGAAALSAARPGLCRFCGKDQIGCERDGMVDYIEQDIPAHDFTPNEEQS